MSAARDPLADLGREPTYAEVMADHWPGGIPAFIARARQRQDQHRATCSAPICRACDRPGCAACGAIVVVSDDETCVTCLVRAAVGPMGIPRRYADALDHLGERVRSPRARQLAAQSLGARGVVVCGPAGVGKSTLAAAMAVMAARAAIEAGRRAPRIRYVTAIDLGAARAQHRLGSGEADLVLSAIAADILILDDLGAEGQRDGEVIATVLHARHNADVPVWLTTGLTPTDVGSRYGGGIERRVYGGAVVIDCAGGSASCGAR